MKNIITQKQTNHSVKIPAEIYSRCVGYYRPVGQWNKGKQAEFYNRKESDVNSLRNKLDEK